MSEARVECASVKTALLTANTNGAVYCEAQSERVPVGRERGSKKIAFTLAEILITLGIIGVVAAMTIPNLIQSYNRRVVETSLKKIYSQMNQAILLSEEDNGARESWWKPSMAGTQEQTEWLNRYIIPYFAGARTILVNNNYRVAIMFNNGSVLMLQTPAYNRDWAFFPKYSKRCLEQEYFNTTGICRFTFYWNPESGDPSAWAYNFVPFAFSNNTSLDSLKNHENYGCYNTEVNSQNWRGYCTELIRRNDWKIPKDYPHKVLTY